MSDEKIHLNDKLPAKEKKKSGILSFFVILFALGAFVISPAPDYIVSLVPDSLTRSIVAPFYQEVILSDVKSLIDAPKKYSSASELNVLGHDSGICFLFSKDDIGKKMLNLSHHGKEIAEVIALDTQGEEYIFDEVTLDEGRNITIICQKLGRRHSIAPNQIKAIYVRPLSPFTTYKIKWVTMKDIR